MTSSEFVNKVFQARGNSQRFSEQLGAPLPFDGTPAQGLPKVKGGRIFALITLSTEANGQLAKMCDGWYKAVTGIDDFLSNLAGMTDGIVAALDPNRQRERELWTTRLSRAMAQQFYLGAEGRFGHQEGPGSRLFVAEEGTMSRALDELHRALAKLKDIGGAYIPMAQSMDMEPRAFQDV